MFVKSTGNFDVKKKPVPEFFATCKTSQFVERTDVSECIEGYIEKPRF